MHELTLTGTSQRLFPGLNKEKFRIFIETLSGFSGQVLNYADIGRLIGVSQTTIREYFKIAHGTFVWRQIHYSCYQNPLLMYYAFHDL